ncbi:ATP-binding protein [Pseudonocardiaceae bacterium YIM PH 21723]|nr:ATP-binding protein [Pseudonocardiaceae bacterium YIM PH 21723]
MLLRFRAENHRSLRESAEFSLVTTESRGVAPADGDWAATTTRVAGIYGANASGKSTVLHALDFARAAVQFSATRWGSRERFEFHPFLLDDDARDANSSYEFDLIVDEVRYTYGFDSSAAGIYSEWLYSYPAGRRRTLFERAKQEFTFGRTLPGENVTISKLVRPTALFLSVAANSNHPVLSGIWQRLAHEIRYARFDQEDQRERLGFVRGMLDDPDFVQWANELLAFADLGIAGVSVDQDVEQKIRFVHHSDDPNRRFTLSLEEESSGTVAWLSLAIPALYSIHQGHVFLIDEIDSSLHPRLTAALIGMFKDPEINTSGAQLIFTSHDTALLGNLVGDVLSADEVWFTEKRADGVTDLYALEEFPTRKSDNIERRYLQGRYGAVPMISPEELRTALTGAK